MATRVSYLPFYRAAYALYLAREARLNDAAQQMRHVIAIDEAAELVGLEAAPALVDRRLGEIAAMRRAA